MGRLYTGMALFVKTSPMITFDRQFNYLFSVSRSHLGIRFLVSMFLMGVILFLHFLFIAPLEPITFLFLSATIFFIAWYYGTGPALVCTFFAVASIFAFLFYYKSIGAVTSYQVVRVFVFTLTTSFVLWVIQKGRRTQLALSQNIYQVSLTEERLRLATEISKVGIWELDLKTNRVITNLNHDQAFGYSTKLSSWSLEEFKAKIHPEDKAQVESTLSHAFQMGERFEYEFRVIWDDGSVHWLSAVASVELDKARAPSRVIGTVVNITDKKKSEEMLHEALFYRDEFLSIASHELKTPLTSLKLQAQMFKRNSQKNDPENYSPERIDRIFEQTDKQVSRLVRLVDDMLDISRIRTGKLSISTENVCLSDIVKDVIERHRPQFQEVSNTELQISRLVECRVKGDRLRIEQVISNLLNNALRYGRGKPVSVSVDTIDKEARIVIQDNGIGISQTSQEKIFSRFQRAVPASEVSGLGLGLYIAKQIVEAHGGQISVDSELNRGSTFIVSLPLIERV